jgi:hypothetical protein
MICKTNLVGKEVEGCCNVGGENALHVVGMEDRVTSCPQSFIPSVFI